MNEANKCVYYRYGGGEGVILCLYVDDILIFGSSLKVIEEVKDFLSNNFEMKDLGESDVILNIKLLREGDGEVTLLQSHYVKKVLSPLVQKQAVLPVRKHLQFRFSNREHESGTKGPLL